MHLLKFLKYLLIIPLSVLLLLISLWVIDVFISKPAASIQYGVTFSPRYAHSLGLDPQEVYQAILNDLKIKNLRLSVYWDEVEPAKNQFDFSGLENLLDQAKDKEVKVILATGYKVPRWPECFPPNWTSNLGKIQHQEQILILLEETVNRFKNRPEIIAWQVENEPLLPFGLCKRYDARFLKKEVELVKALDSRPVILTDSGELSFWSTSMSLSDKMGSSLYRSVWNPFLGHLTYPVPPLYYRLEAAFIKKFFAPNSRGVFLSELQAEPWPPGKSLLDTPITAQLKLLSLKQLQKIVDFASKTGFSEQYLWGVEWWYFMKTQGYPQYWDYAKTLF